MKIIVNVESKNGNWWIVLKCICFVTVLNIFLEVTGYDIKMARLILLNLSLICCDLNIILINRLNSAFHIKIKFLLKRKYITYVII